jgi:ABC-type oligopeptide transport system substrate-binding subunit
MAHDLLYMPIQQEEDGTNTVYIFLRGNTRNEYTRVIYITPAYDETSLKQIANTADLTVIHVVEGKELEYMVQKGFAVIPINADTYQDTIRNIVL